MTSNGRYLLSKSAFPAALKIHRWRHRAGSTPATGTKGSTENPLRRAFSNSIPCIGWCDGGVSSAAEAEEKQKNIF
jgi:hypothetical protein